jgi:hypothetical protein
MKRSSAFPGLWASAATCASSLLLFTAVSEADPVTWGGNPGNPADPGAGILDPSPIPTTGAFTYQDVNNDFDMVVTTSNLNNAGLDFFTNPPQSQPTWWFEGGTRSTTSQSINYSTVTFNFYDANTHTPLLVTGVHFTFQDAEAEERFRNFAYLDGTGTPVQVAYNSSAFTYSSGKPVYHASDGSFDSGSAYEPGTQTGKSIDINFGNVPISGFTFQTGRSLSSYGSVEMTALGNLTPFIDASSDVHIASGASYRGLGTAATTGHGTLAQILDGVASGNKTVNMQFLPGGSTPFQTSSSTGDTLNITGNNGDKFVLQLSYDPSTLPVGTNESTLYLSWFNPNTGLPDFANAGNTDLPGEPNDITTPEFQGAYDPANDFVLGYYGVDTVNHTVWAVIDHNSDFTVVPAPEPTSAVLAACGALPLLLRRRRRSVA